MPRLVVPKDPKAGRFAALQLNQTKADDYKDRLVKYIPVESVALYTFTDKLVASYYQSQPADALLTFLAWALFLVALVGTPLYLRRQRLPGQPWGVHATLSTIAFALWAYTVNGTLFSINHWYHTLIAALLAPIFTFAAALIEPKP